MLQSYLSKTDHKDQLLEKSIDETGRTVYTVPKELGEYFEEIFKSVDANLESLNI